jgi:hypothetical protein
MEIKKEPEDCMLPVKKNSMTMLQEKAKKFTKRSKPDGLLPRNSRIGKSCQTGAIFTDCGWTHYPFPQEVLRKDYRSS